MKSMLSLLLYLVAPASIQTGNGQALLAKSPSYAVAEIAGPQDQSHPDLSLEHADVPFYPPVARAGRIAGTVEVVAIVRDGLVTDAQATSGAAILAKAATENVKTWRFHRWVNARFSTKFIYRIETGKQAPTNSRVELELPNQAVITTVPPLLDAGASRK